MSLSLLTNVSSLHAQRNLFATMLGIDSSLEKLSTGNRITRAGDDAAGSGVAANLNAHVVSYSQAIKNAQDGLALVQVAEGAMTEVEAVLVRLREITMQAASDGVSDTERVYITREALNLVTQIDRLSATTEYNGKFVLQAGTANFQVGIRTSLLDTKTVTTFDVSVSSLGLNGLNMFSNIAATAELNQIDAAIDRISSIRANSATQGTGFAHALATLQATFTNVSEGHGRIRDVDVAEESARLARGRILLSAGISTLAQANQSRLVALKLLSG